MSLDNYCDLNEEEISMETQPLSSPKAQKPAISYAALIAQSLMDSKDGRLALPEIYSWIQDHYEYYREATPAWKNSIRHNLSMNRAFCKAEPPLNAQYKCTYWQFAVPTKVKIGSKGKATVSTTPARPRSRSVGCGRKVYKPSAATKDFTFRRSSMDGVLPIRPRPEWIDRDSVMLDEATTTTTTASSQHAINASDLNYLINPDSNSASSSTIILLSSSSGSPSSDELQANPLPFDIQSPTKLTWTPPPDEMQQAFLYERDPLILSTQNDRSPLMR